MPKKTIFALIIVIFVGLALLITLGQIYRSVPAGHVGVAQLFGEVQDDPFNAGLHFPVNPMYTWALYDVRQKSHKETVQVPSQDQLQTKVDVSIQYRLIDDMAPSILQNTGTSNDVLNVHIIPKLRSVMRESGKTLPRAEDFFKEEVQAQLQAHIKEKMDTFLRPKGVEVNDVLLRDIMLPSFIATAINEKKQREQEIEKQKAELERFRTEQQQKIAEAQAIREAAEEEAATRRLLADAQAYEITAISEAIAKNPHYIKLEALKTLSEMSNDPSSKFYFMDGQSSMPLPLLHMDQIK